MIMAYYQFSLPMTTSESYQLIKTVCERSCTIKQDCPNESIEVRTRFRMGKGSLPFVFYLRELEDGTEIMVSSDNATLTGALVAMNGSRKAFGICRTKNGAISLRISERNIPPSPCKLESLFRSPLSLVMMAWDRNQSAGAKMYLSVERRLVV